VTAMPNTQNTQDTATVPVLVRLPARDELVVDGRGDPDDAPFRDAVGALYAARATLGDPRDVPLEGSYWQAGRRADFDLSDRAHWEWQLVVPAPDGAGAPAAGPVWWRHAPAQQAAELLHRGAFADEGPSLAALYRFAAEHGLEPAGPHVEVYLTDPRTTPDADLRTLLRVPVRPAVP
jgi:hypothetical protein